MRQRRGFGTRIGGGDRRNGTGQMREGCGWAISVRFVPEAIGSGRGQHQHDEGQMRVDPFRRFSGNQRVKVQNCLLVRNRPFSIQLRSS